VDEFSVCGLQYSHFIVPAGRSPNSQLEAAYHRADKAIQKIVDVLAAA